MKPIFIWTLVLTIIVGAFYGIWSVGCSHVSVDVIKKHPPKSILCSIKIYSSKNEINRKYEIVAVLDSYTGTRKDKIKNVVVAIEGARPKACIVGADAIYVEHSEVKKRSTFSYGWARAEIICIKYTD